MLKPFLTVILGVFFFSASAQKKTDTLVYYLKNSGVTTAVKDSADYFLLIMPPDTAVDKKLFIVKEFYPTGRLRLAGNSTTNTISDLKFQGSQVMFSRYGRKIRVANFEDGRLLGDEVDYYPNGKIYCVTNYYVDSTVSSRKFDAEIFHKNWILGGEGRGGMPSNFYTVETYNLRRRLYKECRDSSGQILAENGNGHWIKFLNENFDNNFITGEVVNGLEQGLWRGKIDSVNFCWSYKSGRLLSSSFEQLGKITFTSLDTLPSFKDGVVGFENFLKHNLHYPLTEKKTKDERIVTCNFVVEKDGTLAELKIVDGINKDFDDEAIRVMKLSPPWKPGIYNGLPVRTVHGSSISFSYAK